MKRGFSRIFFGILVILLGVGLLGNAMDWWSVLGFEGWWTLFIIVPALLLMIDNGVHFWNTLILGVGVLLLLKEQHIIESDTVWPILLAGFIIFLGLQIIFGSRLHTVRSTPGFTNTIPPMPGQPDYTDAPAYNIVFGNVKIKNVSTNLTGAKISTVFGSMEVDMTETRISRDVVVETNCVFGTVRIYAPRNYRVKVESISVFGSCDNHAPTLTDQALPLVTIRVNTAFGETKVL